MALQYRSAGSLGWVTRLGHLAGSLGWVTWLGHLAGSLGWVTQPGHSTESFARIVSTMVCNRNMASKRMWADLIEHAGFASPPYYADATRVGLTH
jgi:hypothetical protein